jgi:hypothetical protein
MSRLATTARLFSACWVGITIGATAIAFSEVNDDARVLVIAAAFVAVSASLGAAYALGRGRPRVAGVCLIMAAVAPTFGLAMLNLIPIALGLLLLLRVRGRKPREA